MNYKSNGRKIILTDDSIDIKDTNAQYYFFLIFFLSSLMIGIVNILRHFKSPNLFLLYSGIIMVMIWVPSYIVYRSRRRRKIILIRDIDKVLLTKNYFDKIIAEFVLANSNSFKISLDFNKHYFEKFKEELNNRGIGIETNIKDTP